MKQIAKHACEVLHTDIQSKYEQSNLAFKILQMQMCSSMVWFLHVSRLPAAASPAVLGFSRDYCTKPLAYYETKPSFCQAQRKQASSVHRQASTGRNMSSPQTHPTQSLTSSSPRQLVSINPIHAKSDCLCT